MDEIGASLGMNKTAVYNRLSAARDFLATKLLEDDEEWVSQHHWIDLIEPTIVAATENTRTNGNKRARAAGKLVTRVAWPRIEKLNSWKSFMAYGHDWFGWLEKLDLQNIRLSSETMSEVAQIEAAFEYADAHREDASQRERTVEMLQAAFRLIYRDLFELHAQGFEQDIATLRGRYIPMDEKRISNLERAIAFGRTGKASNEFLGQVSAQLVGTLENLKRSINEGHKKSVIDQTGHSSGDAPVPNPPALSPPRPKGEEPP